MSAKVVNCIVCPSGCEIHIEGEDGKNIQSMEGYLCPRGKEYATNEFIAPKRMLTSTVKANDYKAPVISVRTTEAIPKEKLFECMEVLCQTQVSAPFEIGRVIIPNILDTGVDIVLTNC